MGLKAEYFLLKKAAFSILLETFFRVLSSLLSSFLVSDRGSKKLKRLLKRNIRDGLKRSATPMKQP